MKTTCLIAAFRVKAEDLARSVRSAVNSGCFTEVLIGDAGENGDAVELVVGGIVGSIHLPNVSIGDNRYRLVEAAETEWVQFLDHDDAFTDDLPAFHQHAERIVMDRVGSACPIPPAFFGDTIEVDGDASYVWSRRRSGEGGRSWPGWPPWYGEAVGSTAVATLEEQFIGGFTQTGAILFRKDAWTKMGGILRTPHIAPGEDFDLMLRLLDLGGCVAIRTPIVLYTSWVGHAGSVSDQYTSCWGGDKEAYEAWHHHLRSFVRFRRIASGRPDLRCCYDSNWQAHPVENAATIAKE